MNTLAPLRRIPARTTPQKWEPKKRRAWYDAMIDLQIAEPFLTQIEIADRLRRHPISVGLVINSDLYQTLYRARRAAIENGLRDSIVHKASRVGLRALNILDEDLEKNPEKYKKDPEILLSLADKTLEKLGFGGKNAATISPQVIVNNLSVPSEALAQARAKVVTLEGKRIAEGAQDAFPLPSED